MQYAVRLMNTGVLSVNRLLMDTVREVVVNSSPSLCEALLYY
jgi:hypothetical protein